MITRDNNCYEFIDGQEWTDLARVVVRMEGSDHDEAEGLANARLIAAAPDLLEVLYNMVVLASPFFTDPTQRLLINLARAAIAKAEGKDTNDD